MICSAVFNNIPISVFKSRQKIEHDYDLANRLVQVRHYAAGDHSTPVKTVDFTYNKLRKLETYNDGTTSGTYVYDDLQRKVSATINYGPFSKTIAYSYHVNGLKQSFTDPESVAYQYAYDENNRLSGITIPGQGQISVKGCGTFYNPPVKQISQNLFITK